MKLRLSTPRLGHCVDELTQVSDRACRAAFIKLRAKPNDSVLHSEAVAAFERLPENRQEELRRNFLLAA